MDKVVDDKLEKLFLLTKWQGQNWHFEAKMVSGNQFLSEHM